MRPDGTRVKRLTILPDPGWPFSAPEWSPDGTQLVFTSPSRSSRLGQIYRIDADGSGLTQLTHGTGIDADSASWSPDGSKIVLKRAGSGEYAIWVMNADGSGLVRLTSELYDNSDPTFTPDGKHILYASQKDGYSAIWIMNADGSNKRRLTPAALEAASPDVSPDGSHVVFGQGGDPSRPASIYTMGIDGSAITRLTDPGWPHHDGLPKYSPDGKQIVYLTDRNYPRPRRYGDLRDERRRHRSVPGHIEPDVGRLARLPIPQWRLSGLGATPGGWVASPSRRLTSSSSHL